MPVLQLAKANQDAIEYAEGLLERARAGQVVEVSAIEFQPGGLYQANGTPARNRLETAGALLEAAIHRLGSGG